MKNHSPFFKRSNYVLFSVIFMLAFYSCTNKEDEDLPLPPETFVPNFMPLDVGNSWIYEVVKVDTNGNETLLPYFDTIRVFDQSIINGNTYFHIERDIWLTGPTSIVLKDTVLWRDSIGYLVDVEGAIHFSASDFETILRTENINLADILIEYSVADSLYTYNLPVGNLNGLNYLGLFQYTNPNNPNPDRLLNNVYSNNIGLIYQNIFYSSSFAYDYQRRLKEYELN